MSLKERLDTLPKWPKDAGKIYADYETEERKAWRIVDAYAARLAMAREWIDTRVPHLEGCPWRGLTRDTQGLLPDCRCGRDALLAAIEVPR